MLGSTRARQAQSGHWVAPCTLFSKLQELNKLMYNDDKMEQAKHYVEICAKVYNFQIDNGRYFLHEHPYPATTWGLDYIASWCIART